VGAFEQRKPSRTSGKFLCFPQSHSSRVDCVGTCRDPGTRFGSTGALRAWKYLLRAAIREPEKAARCSPARAEVYLRKSLQQCCCSEGTILFWHVWKSRMHLPARLWALLGTFLVLVQTSAAISLTEPADLGPPKDSSSKIDLIHYQSKILTSATPTYRIILHTYASLLPLSLAASSLLRFYTRLSAAASGPWQSLPELHHFTVEYGNIIINFRASHNYVIPWGFVAEFAAKMSSATERGLREVFRASIRIWQAGR